MTGAALFRGFQAMTEVAERIKTHAETLRIAGKPEAPVWLYPVDYDLIKRYPETGQSIGFAYAADGSIRYGMNPIKRAAGKGRYDKTEQQTP